MTAQSTSHHANVNQSSVAKEAALIVNFYGEHDKLQSLIECLVQLLALAPQGHDSYANATTGALMRHFDPPAASGHDTTIVQMALNTPGAAEAAWKALREQMEDMLPNDDLLKHIWGYTLIYQAELAQDSLSDGVLDILLPAVRRLHPEQPDHPQPLAESDMPGGRLWLISIPLQGNGFQAATVYLALSRPNSNNQLVRDVLYNPIAPLLMADLIAHKSYYQMRQYRLGDLDKRYRDKMAALSRHTDYLLNNLTQASVTEGQLDQLASEYGLLVSAVVHLNQLQVSLQRQQFNFNWWCKQAGSGDVVEFHHNQLENGTQELEFLVAEGQHPLEAANTAVDMVRARLDKQQEGQQQRIESILAAAAAILSVLVLIDKDTAQALLELVRVPQPIGIWHELGVQVFFIVIFSLLAVNLIKKSQRPK